MNRRPRDEVVIRTPDRRLRVFVSSTLGELAEERRAVSRAISAMRLTPVMFEAGARPYPPAEVYRAYLAQADVFIGLYWQRYGQLVPGTRVSGLENEFDLSGGLPRLLYVKAPAPGRDPGLADLLARIKEESSASYRYFRTPAELGRLVRDDLAVLLSERFGAGGGQAASAAAEPSPAGGRGPRPLPVSTTSLLGRERAIDEVAGLVERSGARLVTLTGPGGVGKTRLAVAVGERLLDRFGAGTVFVPLDAVTEPGLVLVAVGRMAGADLRRAGSPLEALAETFGDGAWLLVLDNLEQVVQVARDLGELLARCPGVAIVATSRTVLGLRAEREYPVPPLPAGPATASVAEVAAWPAVALFVDRARAVRPGFALTEGNAAAVAEICRRLEGLPLAIELAAARTRLLDPAALLARLAASLDALGAGPVDLPERQRTLRATVGWSMGLLTDAERSLLEVAAVFSGPGPGCWRPCASLPPSGWPPVPTPPRSGAATPGSTGRWLSRRTGRCAAPARASGWSGWTPRRATWPRRCASTWPVTRSRCRTCFGSCGCSGCSGTLRARPDHGLSSSGTPPARWTCRPAPSLPWWRQ